jgi:hypothetical protein
MVASRPPNGDDSTLSMLACVFPFRYPAIGGQRDQPLTTLIMLKIGM